MHQSVSVREHIVGGVVVGSKGRAMRRRAFFILCLCVCMGWSLEAFAADVCTTPNYVAAPDVEDTFAAAHASADFNRDGKPDLVTGFPLSAQFRVRLGAGAGTFGPPTSFDAGDGVRSFVVGDFNLDGNLDLAMPRTPMRGNSSLAVSLGDGAGGFARPKTYSTANSAYYAATGDLNLDGKPDLVVLTNGTEHISVFLGDGTGDFAPPIVYTDLGGSSPGRPVVDDFNGDGKPDVALANSYLTDTVSVLWGDGAGSFSGRLTLTVGDTPGDVSAGDFNSDGKPDLVVPNVFSNSVSLLLANGAGGFDAAIDFAVGVQPRLIESADLNGDGHLDVATINLLEEDSIGDGVSILIGTGTGDFAPPLSLLAGHRASEVIINDFNGDALNDLVVATFAPIRLAVLLNACPGATPQSTLQFSAPTYQQHEDGGHVVLTVTRTGDTSGAVSADYRTTDPDTYSVSCADATNNNGGAFARCDFVTTAGRLDFATGELQKMIVIPIIDDAHDEGVETFQVVLSNPLGVGLGTSSAATVTIADNDAAGAPNPIITQSPSDYSFFVRQQYLDFLSREPEPNEPWTAVMNRCPNVNTPPATVTDCDRIAVSGAFFGSPEFRIKGFYVFRFYKLAFRRLPTYAEIASDMSFVAGSTEAEVYARKAELARLFTERPNFHAGFNGSASNSFVPDLFSRYQLTQITTPDPAQPDGATKVTLTQAALANLLDTNALTRAQVFRAVADSDEVAAAEYNSAFVAMQYYGYLRRTPDDNGYQAWLRVINQDPNNIRIMINGFLNSTEYKLRFGAAQ